MTNQQRKKPFAGHNPKASMKHFDMISCRAPPLTPSKIDFFFDTFGKN